MKKCIYFFKLRLLQDRSFIERTRDILNVKEKYKM